MSRPTFTKHRVFMPSADDKGWSAENWPAIADGAGSAAGMAQSQLELQNSKAASRI